VRLMSKEERKLGVWGAVPENCLSPSHSKTEESFF